MRLRNCHFQSFQSSSFTSLKNLFLFLSKRKLGGSSTSFTTQPGGSSSADKSNRSFCSVTVACANLGYASLKNLFFVFAFIVKNLLMVFITLIKIHVKYFCPKFLKNFCIEATMAFWHVFSGRSRLTDVYELMSSKPSFRSGVGGRPLQ